MSYFVCGYKNDKGDFETLSEYMFESVPLDVRNTSIRLQGTYSDLVNYGIEKVIPDVVIKKDNGDSWVVVIGTPLMRFKNKFSEQEFLDGFLSSPKKFLRHKIDGNFALFCFDSERKRFLAATDFNNTTPVYFAVRPKGVFFSSHELVLAKFLNAEINPLGFAHAMHLGVTWGAQTRFMNIFKMSPCQMLIVDSSKQTHTESYWKPKEETVLSCNFNELVSSWLSLFSDSVFKYYECADCKPIASDLTGGEDSRLLVAQCHASGIPFQAEVVGSDGDSDVTIAKRASSKSGIDLIVSKNKYISEEELLANAKSIILRSDAHQGFVDSCNDWATKRANTLNDYKIVKLCGVGGEELRGTYYLRGKAIFPSRRSNIDYKFFTKLKYLLDYHPGLLVYQDDKFLDSVYGMAKESLSEVEEFPIGTQVDHLLRVFQTCFLAGTKYKNPLYLPFMTREMIRSIYYIPPQYKQGGRLTRACTEILFPELAYVKTQKGIPTIRKTLMRLPLFIPEYFYLMKSIHKGVVSRFFKWKQPRPLLSMEKNAYIFATILGRGPYNDWFSSSNSMVTGHLYNSKKLNSILIQARAGSFKNVPVLGRIINLELACRWVYRYGL